MKNKGFTVIELMIGLFVVSILATWGLPNYHDFKLRQMMRNNTNELVYAMTLARAEAIRRGVSVSISPEDGRWEDGWVVFTDMDRNGQQNGDDVELFRQDPLEDGMQVSLSGENNHITYGRMGTLIGDTQLMKIGNGGLRDYNKSIRIMPSGMLRSYTL